MNEKMTKVRSGAEEIVWDLSDLYRSTDDPNLKRDRKKVVELSKAFANRYRGTVASLTPVEFADALTRYEDILTLSGKIGSYAYLSWSVNTENALLGKDLQQATELGSEVSQLLVFFSVEWMNVDDEQAEEIIQSPVLAPWKHYLRVSRLYKNHTLSEDAEQVLSATSVTARSAWNRYFDETLGAARFEFDGEQLTEQELLGKLHNEDRSVRQKAHKSLSETFQTLSRSLTFIFNTVLSDKATRDKFRGYTHWLDSRNLSNQTDKETVEALIDAVTSSYPLVQRYYRLKKKVMGLDQLFDYDRYAPVAKSSRQVEWEKARELVLDAFGEFHPRKREIASHFFEKRWIDAAIRPGKRGGAYSASTVTTVHPYVFMNYEGRLRDVQTLAHELGHGVHQYLSAGQGELQSSTPLTTAETASVFGEMLVFNRLMDQLTSPEERLALLISKIDDTIATVFRQISMNRFEEKIHTLRRVSGELTKEQFSQCWIESQKALYGDSVTLTDEYSLWWCYIPHFLHSPGYVYAYAFGELLVLSLFDLYQKSDSADFSARYLDLLSAGGSDWPADLIATMGIDIRDSEFWKNGLALFEKMVLEAEELAGSL